MTRAIKELYELLRLSHESGDFLHVSCDLSLGVTERHHVILRSILQCFADFEKMPETSLQQYSSDVEHKTMRIYSECRTGPVSITLNLTKF